jgi:hypothetical protein
MYLQIYFVTSFPLSKVLLFVCSDDTSAAYDAVQRKCGRSFVEENKK